jgi:hypothetical protein
VIDHNSPFILRSQGKFIGDTIQVHSEKHNQIMTFLQNNRFGWQYTPASYISSFSIHQDNFHMTLLKKGGVVISFMDKDGKSKQFIKTVEPTQLLFLRN